MTTGTKLTIRAKPTASLKQVGYSHDCFYVRLGEGGTVYKFDTKGQYNWSKSRNRRTYWNYKPELTLTVEEDCSLWISHNQENRMALTVDVLPPK